MFLHTWGIALMAITMMIYCVCVCECFVCACVFGNRGRQKVQTDRQKVRTTIPHLQGVVTRLVFSNEVSVLRLSYLPLVLSTRVLVTADDTVVLSGFTVVVMPEILERVTSLITASVTELNTLVVSG